jgi:hypothetical protein
MLSDQINVLNQAYGPSNFEFVLSGVSQHTNNSW